ncbi:MAG: O-antigen ligase family protein [Mediterranea sp.]|jgi:O-antigen ligase|nr:O-antigen ligase family protein [Mediterranea sp.]
MKKQIANVFLFVGIFTLLSSVLCVDVAGIPAGEVAYQQLWIGRLSVVFVVCAAAALLLTGKGRRLCFSGCVSWSLIVLGGIEAVWGLMQVYGLLVSQHSLFALTGSVYNPGPYAGYLALVFPLCLHQWLRLRRLPQRAWYHSVGLYLSLLVLLLIIGVLPAGMSRTAWMAVVVSGLWVYGVHASWGARLNRLWRERRRQLLFCGILSFACLLLVGVALFQFKAGSANGRLFMWKISSQSIAERPFTGYGEGHFVVAYGDAQERYFAAGHYTPTEERVAGSPEYAFNEYLQLAVEWGVPALLLSLCIIGVFLFIGIRSGRTDVAGGLIAFLVFAFASYPLRVPGLALAFCFLVLACGLSSSRTMLGLVIIFVCVLGLCCWHRSDHEACRSWADVERLYAVGAYQPAAEEYAKLYPQLKDRGLFLFEYGRCLNKLGDYNRSTEILQEAEAYSCDPMILNVIGQNYQALGRYPQAEACLIRSTHRLPGRIYPYYLLAKLYANPTYYHPEKLKQMVRLVLAKEPKVQSTAIREMREEVKRLERL